MPYASFDLCIFKVPMTRIYILWSRMASRFILKHLDYDLSTFTDVCVIVDKGIILVNYQLKRKIYRFMRIIYDYFFLVLIIKIRPFVLDFYVW